MYSVHCAVKYCIKEVLNFHSTDYEKYLLLGLLQVIKNVGSYVFFQYV